MTKEKWILKKKFFFSIAIFLYNFFRFFHCMVIWNIKIACKKKKKKFFFLSFPHAP